MDETAAQRHGHVNQDVTVEMDEINLIDYFRVIFKYRKMILWICVIVVVATAIYSLLLPKIYSATASIVPPIDGLGGSSGLRASAMAMAEDSMLGEMIGIRGPANVSEMYASILESRVVADVIIDRFNLMDVYKEKYKSQTREVLKNKTVIDISDAGIVSITVEDKAPARAAAMANAYVTELDRRIKGLSAGQATSKRIFLANRLKEIEGKLAEVENILSREAKTQEMLFELLTREYEIAKIEEAKSMPTIQILDWAVMPEKKCKPKRTQMVMLSGVTALLIAIFTAFVREYFLKVNMQQSHAT
ncbi:MAG: Wzz/FepE/Etk N-terminal domain-containing protein [Planctomycetota bacterium]|jgi:uncharacterized protein involved in exopolysaccharide biosynthesis